METRRDQGADGKVFSEGGQRLLGKAAFAVGEEAPFAAPGLREKKTGGSPSDASGGKCGDAINDGPVLSTGTTDDSLEDNLPVTLRTSSPRESSKWSPAVFDVPTLQNQNVKFLQPQGSDGKRIALQ